MTLFGRQVIVRLGPAGGQGRELTGLRVGFTVKLSATSSVNSATITIYNPAPDTISAIQDPTAVVELLAGYSVARLRFRGNPTPGGVSIARQGPDRILKIEAQEAGYAWRSARVALSYTAAVDLETVYADVSTQLGLPAAVVQVPAGISFAPGLVLSGLASDILARLAAMSGSQTFTRDGAICFIPIDGDTGDVAPVFSAASGNLIGSPTPTAVSGSTSSNGVKVRALLDADLRPGQKFQVQSESYNGTYVATDVQMSGDSGWATDFYLDATGTAS